MTFTELVSELVKVETSITKSMNFGNGQPTKKQITQLNKVTKELVKFGLDVDEYNKLVG